MDSRSKCKMQKYNLLEFNIRENLGNLKYGNGFLDETQRAKFMKK